jgi:hypothetical protein
MIGRSERVRNKQEVIKEERVCVRVWRAAGADECVVFSKSAPGRVENQTFIFVAKL